MSGTHIAKMEGYGDFENVNIPPLHVDFYLKIFTKSIYETVFFLNRFWGLLGTIFTDCSIHVVLNTMYSGDTNYIIQF